MIRLKILYSLPKDGAFPEGLRIKSMIWKWQDLAAPFPSSPRPFRCQDRRHGRPPPETFLKENQFAACELLVA